MRDNLNRYYQSNDNSPFVSKDSHKWEIDELNARIKNILVNNAGAISGKNVLDLACGTGAFSHVCYELGAKTVTAVDARAEKINFAREVIKKGTFIQSDVFDYLAKTQRGDFDTVLCLGFLYHTTKQVEFFRQIERIRPDCLILETSFVRNFFKFGFDGFTKPPVLVFFDESDKADRDTIERHGYTAWPTKAFLEYMFRKHGMDYRSFTSRPATIRNWFLLRSFVVGYIAWPKA